MKFDSYTLTARLYPAIICLLPFLVFTISCKIDGLESIFDGLLKVRILGNITSSIVLLYFLMLTNRFLGKFLFGGLIFNDGLNLPTTRFLLYSDSEFSEQYKDKIRQKINKNFKIILPSREDELSDINSCKKRIVEAVGLIRNKVKNGNLLLQHDMEYGFARNLIGGSIIAVCISGFDIFYFMKLGNVSLGYLSIILTIFFSLCLILNRPIINHLGKVYAKRLFQEYF
jgi:hypothetical protein